MSTPSPAPRVPSLQLFVVCDFDGTVTTTDTLDLLLNHFAPGAWEHAEERLQSGEINLLEAMREEFIGLRVPEDQVLAFVLEHAVIREGFPEFVRWIDEAGHRLVIVSAGFRILIDAILARAGLEHLHVHAGDALFGPNGTVISYPPSSAECVNECGICKTETIATHGPFNGPVVYVGDGYSDRCAAREADLVFARDYLAVFLEREGVAFEPYEDFHDVLSRLRRLEAGWPAPDRAPSPATPTPPG